MADKLLVALLIFLFVVSIFMFGFILKDNYECSNCTQAQVEKAMAYNQQREAIHQEHKAEAISYLNSLGDKN